MAKKLWAIIRAILYMLKKGSKNIPWFELHMLLKRTTKIAGKAIGNILLDHQTLTCRPNSIHNTVVAPLAYEFSCSNTPLFHHKRKHNNKRSHYPHHSQYSHSNHELTVNNVKKVFDILNSYESDPEKSPMTLLGFGESPNVRQLRVTDSPFPEDNNMEEEEEEEDVIQVDMKAEEFIKNFYKELLQQKKRAAVEPPSPLDCYRKWGQVR